VSDVGEEVAAGVPAWFEVAARRGDEEGAAVEDNEGLSHDLFYAKR